MAELALSNVVKSLSQAEDELLHSRNLKAVHKKLKATINTIKDVLHNAEESRPFDVTVPGWVLGLRDVLYEADDLLDAISTGCLRKRVLHGSKYVKNIRLFFSESNHLVLAITRFTTAHKMKQLRERLDGIVNGNDHCNTIRGTIPALVRAPPLSAIERVWHDIETNVQTQAYTLECDVIGREKEREEILSMLLADVDGQESASVIAVMGIKGIGKTALAQLVYDAKEVVEFFDLRLWVCVEYCSGLPLDQLQNMLKVKIQRKRFLLVLDGVKDGDSEQQLTLKHLLDGGERGSRILVTTRLQEVAQNLATSSYTLVELSDDDAWSLLKKLAIDCKQEEEILSKETLGRQIIEISRNVPIAIKTMCRLVFHKDKKQWSEFMKKVQRGSVGYEGVNRILKLSYNNLPPSLRNCFAYCSLFPKHWVFDKTDLIRLWMAQGLIETTIENQCLEDIGENYFSDLSETSFFQCFRDGDGNISSCSIYDAMHDLTVGITGNDFLQMTEVPDDFRERSPKPHHIYVREINDSLFEAKGLRSLFCTDNMGSSGRTLGGLFLHLTSLRALSLTYLNIEEIPSSIGKLVHLRYLDLSNSEALTELPAALCKLQNLLTLRLAGCSHLKKLPDDLQKLRSLRHLETADCHKLNYMPSGLKELNSLVVLDQFVVHEKEGGLRWLKRLNGLRGSIDIKLPAAQWKNWVADAEESMLGLKTKLSGLAILWDDPTEREYMSLADADAVLYWLEAPECIIHLKVVNFPGKKFPNWLSSLGHLVKLCLAKCSKCLSIPRLGSLLKLKWLKLESIPLPEYLEEDISLESKLFLPALEFMELVDMPSLKAWWKLPEEEVNIANPFWFPRLFELRLTDCPELRCLPACPVVEILKLVNVHVNLLKQLLSAGPKTVDVEANSPPVPSSSVHQSWCRLEFVSIMGIKDPTSLPDDFKRLHKLIELRILDCPNFERHSLFRSLQHLTALRNLRFKGGWHENLEKDGMLPMPWISLTKLETLACEFGSDAQGAHLLNGLHHLNRLRRLEIYKDVPLSNDWKVPPNLCFLEIVQMCEVSRLNGIIQQLEELRSLAIIDCNVGEDELDKLSWEHLCCLSELSFHHMPMMKSLPDKCQYLPCLETLDVVRCPELTTLPDWTSHLMLKIDGCPKLEEKC